MFQGNSNSVAFYPFSSQWTPPQHYLDIAFAVSAYSMFFFSPISFLFGSVLGYMGSTYWNSNLQIQKNESILTTRLTTLALVGGLRNLIYISPIGILAEGIFSLLPMFASISVGIVAHRIVQSLMPKTVQA